MNAERSREALDDLGVCFLFAPKYHTGFRHAMPVRQQLKTRTLFNVLGPLINPAHPPLALIGVYSPELVLPIAETLRVLGYQRAAVVHSGGMDEVSLHAPTLVAELNHGEVLNYQLEAADFGLTRTIRTPWRAARRKKTVTFSRAYYKVKVRPPMRPPWRPT